MCNMLLILWENISQYFCKYRRYFLNNTENTEKTIKCNCGQGGLGQERKRQLLYTIYPFVPLKYDIICL